MTKSQHYLEQVPSGGGYFHRDTTMKDSFQLPDPVLKDRDTTMKDSFQLPDPVLKDKQKPMEEGYASSNLSSDASSNLSSDYSEEVTGASSSDDDGVPRIIGGKEQAYLSDASSTESGEGFSGKINGKYAGIYACLNDSSSDSDVPGSTVPGSTVPGSTVPGSTVPGSTEEKEEERNAFDQAMEHFYSSKPTMSTWKMSWPKEAKLGEHAWVNVYGHYSKQTNSGGYAVILRNMSAEPIAASVKFLLGGNSFFYQVLDGLVAGLGLSKKHGCSSPDVRCNSGTLVALLRQVTSGSCKCKGGRRIGKICKRCARAILPFTSDQSFETLVPLIKKLKGKKLDCTKFDFEPRKTNAAAHYLAKEARKKALLNKKLLVKRKRVVPYSENFEPKDFSDKLVSILLDDAFDMLYYNKDAMSKIAQSFSSCK